jgi:hypothetical protein
MACWLLWVFHRRLNSKDESTGPHAGTAGSINHLLFTIYYLKFNHHHFQSESGAGDQIQSGASSGNLKKST